MIFDVVGKRTMATEIRCQRLISSGHLIDTLEFTLRYH